MLKLNSANERDGIEEQFALQETGGFKREIRELESLIANLTEQNTPAGKANGQKSKKNRSFGFQKLRLRRSNKKKPANAEETKEEFMERVKFLQGVCNDLTARLKEDELANGKSAPEEPTSNMEEARDDDEIMDFRRRVDDEEREREEERDELLAAIVACEKVLSKFSDNTEDLPDVESIESYDNEIEITESKFLVTRAEEEAFFAAMEEYKETTETEIEIQWTQSEAAENATSFVCCASDFKIIEMIENLVRNLVGGESQEKTTEEQQEEVQETDRTEEDVGIIAVTSTAAAYEKQADEPANEAADDDETSALGCAFFNMCCLQTTNTDIEPVMTFSSPEESQQAKASDEPKDRAGAVSSETDEKKENEASNYALFNAFSEEEQTLNPNPTAITTDTMSMTVGRPKALGCCEPFLVTVCALDDPNLDAYSLAESMKDSDDIREPQESPSRPALVTAKSMETEFTTLETQTIDGKTLATQTVDGKTIGTIDQGLFTSLDSIVGAKKISNAVKNEDFLDMLVAEDVVAGAVANAVLKVYDCQACAIESPSLDFLGVGAFTENAVIKPVSTMDFIPRIEVVNTKVKKPSKKKKATTSKKNQKKTAITKKKAPAKKAVRNVQTQDLLKLSAMKSAETEGVRNISAVKSAETQDIRKIKSISTMDFIPRLEVARSRKKTTAKKATKKTSKKQNKAQSPKKQGTSKKKASNTKKVGKKTSAAKKVPTTKRLSSPTKRSSGPTKRTSGPKKVQKKLSQSEYRRIMAKKRREQRKRDIANGKQEASGQELDTPIAKARHTKIKHESPESLAQKSINEIPPPDFADLLNFFNPLPPHMREGYLPNPRGDDTASSLTEWTPGTGLKEISVQNDEGENKNRWFFQRVKKEEYPDIEEALSPVFSIPNVDTHGTRFDEHDEEYVNNYYSFNENGDEYHPYN